MLLGYLNPEQRLQDLIGCRSEPVGRQRPSWWELRRPEVDRGRMDDGHYDRVLALQAEDDFPLALRELRIQ